MGVASGRRGGTAVLVQWSWPAVIEEGLAVLVCCTYSVKCVSMIVSLFCQLAATCISPLLDMCSFLVVPFAFVFIYAILFFSQIIDGYNFSMNQGVIKRSGIVSVAFCNCIGCIFMHGFNEVS